MAKAKPAHVIELHKDDDETDKSAMARAIVSPYFRHGIVNAELAKKAMGELPGKPGFNDFGKDIQAKAKLTVAGDMTLASEMLTAQALSLDAMMTELMRRATMNLDDYPLAAERYARLAFKAQANSRASLQALAKLHQPREQTVRHVHVNEGGQAVVADNFHNHTGGRENEKSSEQPHATNVTGESPSLLGSDTQGNGMPIASGKGKTAMQNARRQR